MRKLYITSLICFFISTSHLPILAVPNNCNLHTKRVASIHHNLKKLIHNEMLQIPDDLYNKEKLKGIWYQGGHRTKIGRITSKKNLLTKRDLYDLKFYITQEKKLLESKIKNIAKTINQHLFSELLDAVKFTKSGSEIKELFKDIEISADELIEKEHKTYDTIINKIEKIININA